MPNTEQTLESDAPLGNGAGQEDAEVKAADVTQAAPTDAQKQEDALVLLREVTKRDFKTKEEAKKYLENLNRLVGDQTIAKQRERAKLADTLVSRVAVENSMSIEEAESYLANLTNNMEQQPQRVQTPDPQLEERLRRGERAEFLMETPEAKPFLDKIEEYSKATGKSYKESYDTLYSDVVKAERERKQTEEATRSKKEAQVFASTNTETEKMPDEYAKMMDQYRKTGNGDFLREAIKIKNGLRK